MSSSFYCEHLLQLVKEKLNKQTRSDENKHDLVPKITVEDLPPVFGQFISSGRLQIPAKDTHMSHL